ncbi:MAG: hypothetical protein P4L90_21125 [Rhodopila sp.]|nr:hypothetical protein [Rhodopila sp.]
MMPSSLKRLAVSLSPLLLVAACGPSGQQRTVQLLGERLQTELAPDIAANRAALQPLPDGAQVTLLGSSLFPSGARALRDQETDVRASVVEGLVDPSLVQIGVTDTSALPADTRDTRVRNVTQYLEDFGLGASLQPTAPSQAIPPGSAGLGPAGLTLTISVQCPQRQGAAGYGTGAAEPACD